MPFGIVLKGFEPVKSKANFYVPKINSYNASTASLKKFSHVVFETRSNSLIELSAELEQLCISPIVTILVHLPTWTSADELFRVLAQAVGNFTIIVPVLEDIEYYEILRDLFKTPSTNITLMLSICRQTEAFFLDRYKCLNYVAVYLGNFSTVSDNIYDDIYDDIAHLMRKKTRPSLLIDEAICKATTYQFWKSISEQKLEQYSDMFIDPLQPLVVDLDLDIYETFEKDHTKYDQYRNAIELAISDLRHKRSSINIMVIGPGRGPLLAMVMDFARNVDEVVAVEKNAKCIPHLRRWCEKRNVQLLTDDVRNLSREKLASFHLVVSELLGSFGCNEAAPEILNIFKGLTPVMIPQEVQSYVQAIYTDIPLGLCTNRPYLVKLSSFYPVCDPIAIFGFTFPDSIRLNQQMGFELSTGHDEMSNGFYGYFEAVLYGPYKIGILPTQARSEYCNSWFPMLFPISETRMPVDVKFTRSSAQNLIYEWEVNGKSYGHEYIVRLS